MNKIIPTIPKNKVYNGQFLITKSNNQHSDFLKTQFFLGEWRIFLSDDINTISLVDNSENLIGLFIGNLIDYNNNVVIKEKLIFDVNLLKVDQWEETLEDFIYQFAGSYLLILNYNGHERIYLDANGSKSLIYNPANKTVASTSGVLLNDEQYISQFNAVLYQFLDIYHDGWFPSGLTAHHGIQRLLCNHYLDLNSFETIRHWPKSDFDHSGITVDNALRIAEISKQFVLTLLEDGNTICALTGGNETRFILAACSSILNELEFCTIDAPFTKKDVYIAKKIAKQLNLNHRLLPIKKATIEDQYLWQYQAGHCVGGLNLYMHPTVKQISNYKYFVGGLGGEIGRAFFWKSSDNLSTQLEGKDIASRFGMQNHPETIQATNKWFLSVKDFNPITQLDLAYMELRMSAWCFSQSYANPLAQSELHPLICRESFTLMMQLTADAKRNNLLIKNGIEQLLPQLDNISINKYGNYMDLVESLNKISDIKRVTKKLRKLGIFK